MVEPTPAEVAMMRATTTSPERLIFDAGCQTEMRKNVDVQKNEEGEEPTVVSGIGLVAAQDFHKGGFLLDSAAVHFKDPPPSYGREVFDDDDGDSYRNVVIGGQEGYFQLRSYSENTPWASTSFYMNEA
jgi:hypothetical protein